MSGLLITPAAASLAFRWLQGDAKERASLRRAYVSVEEGRALDALAANLGRAAELKLADVTAAHIGDGLRVEPRAAKSLARTAAAWIGGTAFGRYALEERLEKAWSAESVGRGNGGAARAVSCLPSPIKCPGNSEREESEMGATGPCVGGWQCGAVTYQEIAPVVIKRIPAVMDGPPYPRGSVVDVANQVRTNPPTVYGVIRDLRDGRPMDDPDRSREEVLAAQSRNGHHPEPVAVQPVVTEREASEPSAPAGQLPPAEPIAPPASWVAERQKLRALLPSMYSTRDLGDSFADYIGTLNTKWREMEAENKRLRAAPQSGLAAAANETADSLRADLARQAELLSRRESELAAAADREVEFARRLRELEAERDAKRQEGKQALHYDRDGDPLCDSTSSRVTKCIDDVACVNCLRDLIGEMEDARAAAETTTAPHQEPPSSALPVAAANSAGIPVPVAHSAEPHALRDAFPLALRERTALTPTDRRNAALLLAGLDVADGAAEDLERWVGTLRAAEIAGEALLAL